MIFMTFLKQNWFRIVSIAVIIVLVLLIVEINDLPRQQEENYANIATSVDTTANSMASKSDEEWEKEFAQYRTDGKKICDEFQQPGMPLEKWKDADFIKSIVCNEALAIKDYLNVTYLIAELANPASEYSPEIKHGKINDINFAVLDGDSTRNYYMFFTSEQPKIKFLDLLVNNDRRHNPSYKIASDSFGNEWFVSTRLAGSGSDQSDYVDSWYWVDKNSLKLKKVLEYSSLGGFGTGWGIFNDSGWLGGKFSVTSSNMVLDNNSYFNFSFERSYDWEDENLLSNTISMRYRWDPDNKSFSYVSGNTNLKLADIDGMNPLSFVKGKNNCEIDWIFCMYSELVDNNYGELTKIALGEDTVKKGILAKILVKNPDINNSADEGIQALNWYHNLPKVKHLLELL